MWDNLCNDYDLLKSPNKTLAPECPYMIAAHWENASTARLAKAVLFAAILLASGCNDAEKTVGRLPTKVDVITVAIADHSRQASLTGIVAAQVTGNLAFRIAGRIAERTADVGQHVSKGEVLAKIDPSEQQADVVAAQANVDAANAQLAQVSANFDRQKALLAKGLTSRKQYDDAEEAFRVATGTLEAAKAGLANARENLTYTELRATADGLITSRSIEIGQTVQAAQTAFTVAEDGDRDAVFYVPEIFTADSKPPPVKLRLIADPAVVAVGQVREISPVLDPKTASIRVKVSIPDTPKAMTLGAAVIGSISAKPEALAELPWSALSSKDGQPAVWIIDPKTRAVALNTIGIRYYDGGSIFVDKGLAAGQQVVTSGAQLLSTGQVVEAEEAHAQ